MLTRFLQKHLQFLLITFITIIVTFVCRFPDMYAYLTTPAGMVFLGKNSWFDPADIDIYVSAIHYGQLGHLLLPNLWTALPNQPLFFFPVEVLSGFLFRFLNPYLLFWLMSIVCSVLLITTMFFLIRKSGLSYPLTTITTLGIALGGGFGFFLYPHIPSADITTRLTFYATFFKPHEAIAVICYLYGFVMFFEIVAKQKKINLQTSIFLAGNLIIMSLIYPYLLISYTLITISFLLLSNGKISKTHLAIIFIPAVITVLFMSWQITLNQGFTLLVKQHLPTQPLPTLLGYGILVPIFVYQLFFMKKTQFVQFLTLWIVITMLLALLPFGPGRVFLVGLFFPLVLLAVLQINKIFTTLPHTPLKIIYWSLFLTLLCVTNVSLIFLRNISAHTDEATNIVYMDKEEFRMLPYLNQHTPPNSGVLAGIQMSNLITAYTANRSAVGSMSSATPEYTRGKNAILAFYTGKPVEKDYLKKNNISYVLWGPTEQQITNTYQRGEIINDLSKIYKNLKLVYETKTSKLYKVQY